jgi:hypothetical protein
MTFQRKYGCSIRLGFAIVKPVLISHIVNVNRSGFSLILDAIISHSESKGKAWFDRPFDLAQDRPFG